jgi:hypothetical protein
MRKHGEIVTDDPEWPHGMVRHCDAHGQHGPLYVCATYPSALQRELELEGRTVAMRTSDPGWQAKQRARGIPQVVLDMFSLLNPPS